MNFPKVWNKNLATSLLDDYQYIARHIAVKNTLYTKRDKPSLLSNLLYYICLFIVVVVLAGVLTGFGQAAPIISAIVSLFPFVNILFLRRNTCMTSSFVPPFDHWWGGVTKFECRLLHCKHQSWRCSFVVQKPRRRKLAIVPPCHLGDEGGGSPGAGQGWH